MGRPWRRVFAGLAIAALGAAPSPPDRRVDPAEMAAQLRAAERDHAAGLAAAQQNTAAALAAQHRADALADARVAAAARLRVAEDDTEVAAERMAELADQRRTAQARLAQQAANLGPLLPLIERLALYPLETLLAIPADPEQTLRGVTVLAGITHDMERQAETLTHERVVMARLSAAMAVQAPGLAAARLEQATQAAALDVQISQARQTMTAAEQAAQQAARDAAAAAGREGTLREMVARLDAEQAQAAALARRRRTDAGHALPHALADAPGPGRFGMGGSVGGGRVGAPVAGSVLHAFGSASEAGPVSGISFQPPPAARVVAPCAGRSMFAGPFRSYGLLLIVDCGGGYLFVLAGLARLDTQVGRAVRAGEPVGAMAAWNPAGVGSRPVLYVELRRDGVAIDPAPFLRAHG